MKEITNEPFELNTRNFIRVQIINVFAKYCNNYFNALKTANLGLWRAAGLTIPTENLMENRSHEFFPVVVEETHWTLKPEQILGPEVKTIVSPERLIKDSFILYS
jgi:hypothetical protein